MKYVIIVMFLSACSLDIRKTTDRDIQEYLYIDCLDHSIMPDDECISPSFLNMEFNL